MKYSKRVYEQQRLDRQKILVQISAIQRDLEDWPEDESLKRQLEVLRSSLSRINQNRINVSARAFGLTVCSS